jgi:predicted N-acyltransferase
VSGLSVRIATSLAAIDARGWDACANPEESNDSLASLPTARSLSDDALYHQERFNPFISHAFLASLENSGSTGGRSGWTPAHVLVEDEAGAPPRLRAVLC